MPRLSRPAFRWPVVMGAGGLLKRAGGRAQLLGIIARALLAPLMLFVTLSGPVSAHVLETESGTPNLANFPVCPSNAFSRWQILDTQYQRLPDDPATIKSAVYSQGKAELGDLHGCVHMSWRSFGSLTGQPEAMYVYRGSADPNEHCSVYTNGHNIFHSCIEYKFWLALPQDRPNLGPCPTCPKPAAGNPINTATGNKFQLEVDYQGQGAFPLRFGRYFNAQDDRVSRFGRGWRQFDQARSLRKDFGAPVTYNASSDSPQYGTAADACVQGWSWIKSRAIGLADTTASVANGACELKEGSTVRATIPINDNTGISAINPQLLYIYADREDGSSVRFTRTGSAFTPDPGVTARLEEIAGGYRYTDSDVIEEYNVNGAILLLRHRSGITHTITRNAAMTHLQSISDSFGRTISFTYNALDKFHTLTDPDGKVYTYGYNGNADVETVTFPDGKIRRYHYEDPAFPRLLTGITDEESNRFATWTYDSVGRAKSSEHADGVPGVDGADRVDVAYNADGTATVTDALEKSTTFTFNKVNGIYKPTIITESCAGCGTSSTITAYDNNGFVSSRTDRNEHVTTYVNNSRGLEESRTEGYGTTLARTITTQWHATYGLPLQIDEPGRRTVNTYDSSGNRLTQTVSDTATNESRTTTWTYNSFGQVLTIDGPRTDVSDLTTFTYGAQGNLEKITNALNHETRITEYDAHGNPESILDANSVVTTLTYDLRQRLKTRTVAGETISFDYDGVGQLTKVTLPGGAFLSYTYDAAHRLTGIQDSAGNKIQYTLDAMGNRTKEEVRDPANALKRKQTQVFDMLSRLQQIKDAGGNVVSQFGYDAQGNRISQTDAGLFDTTYVPDELNRIKEVLDAANGTTLYTYNSLDQLIKVTDPEQLDTSYTVNAFGDVTKQVSPDTDETNYTVDAAGNRTSQTDQRGVTVNYTFDKLNRLTLVDYVDSTTEDVAYSYDSTAGGNYGIGRLTGVQDEGGVTSLQYDARGNLIEEKRVAGSGTYTTSYTFDAADRVATITYPSLRVVTYGRNANGQVTKVTSTIGTVTTDIATDIEHLPFGGIKSYKLGNNVAVTRTHDQDYRITGIKDQFADANPIQHLDLDYDLRSNITARADLVDSVTEALGYDDLSRLTSSTGGGYGTQGFTYDGVGNRQTQTGATSETYTYTSGTHRLATAGGTSFVHDDAGNVTTKGSLTLTYNLAGRLSSVVSAEAGAQVANVYSASGQRVKKTAGGVETLFFHDRQGHLLAEEFSGDQRVRREYIWLGDIPLALESVRTVPEVVVDNAGTGFSSAGAWTTATAADQYGSSYLKRGPAIEPIGGAQSIVDDSDSGASYTGTWVPSSSTCGVLCLPPNGFVSSDAAYQNTYYRSDTSGTPVFTWNVTLPGAGRYRVYVRWARLGGSGLVSYAISQPAAVHSVDQSQPSGEWYALGSYEFGASAQVTLTPGPGIVAVADAVRFVAIEDTDSEFTRWAPIEAGAYEAFARWPSDAAATAAAPFSITDATGSIDLNQDQSAGAGTWNSLGEFTFDDPATQGVRLGVVWDETVLADAVRFTPVGAERRHLAFFHVDHLNTPQKMTDASQAIVWEASYEPFGKATITAQPHFDNPLRFPGQYFDAETGLHQNWHRDYDPSIGRYLQSDPIGLDGGINTYAYVGSNPLNDLDPKGLSGRYSKKCGRCTVTYDSDQWKGAHTHWQCPGQAQGCIKKDGTLCDGSAPPPPEVKECLQDWGRIPQEMRQEACGQTCKNVVTVLVVGGVVVGGFCLAGPPGAAAASALSAPLLLAQ